MKKIVALVRIAGMAIAVIGFALIVAPLVLVVDGVRYMAVEYLEDTTEACRAFLSCAKDEWNKTKGQ